MINSKKILQMMSLAEKHKVLIALVLYFSNSISYASDFGPWACTVQCAVEKKNIVSKSLCFGDKIVYEKWSYEGPVGSCSYTKKITYTSRMGSSDWACIAFNEYVIPCVGDVTAYSSEKAAIQAAYKNCEVGSGGKVIGMPDCHRQDR